MGTTLVFVFFRNLELRPMHSIGMRTVKANTWGRETLGFMTVVFWAALSLRGREEEAGKSKGGKLLAVYPALSRA